MGDRKILLLGFVNVLIQVSFSYYPFISGIPNNISHTLIITDIIIAALTLLSLIAYGALRIFLTSKHPSLYNKVLVILFMWIPPHKLLITLRYCKIVKKNIFTNTIKQTCRIPGNNSKMAEKKTVLSFITAISKHGHN